MAAKYNLQPNEWVVLLGQPGAHHSDGRGRSDTLGSTSSQELVLTNMHIILVTSSMFGKPKGVRYFPLATIRPANGRPQILITKVNGRHTLQVHFQHGQENFAFSRKSEAVSWLDNIEKILMGTSYTPRDRDLSIPGASYVAESLKDTIGVFKESFGAKTKGEPAREPVVRKCASCSAPLSGLARQIVRCQYCDTDQQL